MPDVLTPRETRLASLLLTAVQMNDEGLRPTKAELIARDCGEVRSTRTRADLYRQIQELIRRGLLTSEGLLDPLAPYALQVTTAGRHEANRLVLDAAMAARRQP